MANTKAKQASAGFNLNIFNISRLDWSQIGPGKLRDVKNTRTVPRLSYAGKKRRAELLVHIKERAGMTYREIAKLDLFADLELSSLGCIYRRVLSKRPG